MPERLGADGIEAPARSVATAPAGTISTSTGGSTDTSIITTVAPAPVAYRTSPDEAAVTWLCGPIASVARGTGTATCGGVNVWSGPLQPFAPCGFGTTTS